MFYNCSFYLCRTFNELILIWTMIGAKWVLIIWFGWLIVSASMTTNCNPRANSKILSTSFCTSTEYTVKWGQNGVERGREGLKWGHIRSPRGQIRPFFDNELTQIFLQAKFLFFECPISLLGKWKIGWYTGYVHSSIEMTSNEIENCFLHHVRY